MADLTGFRQMLADRAEADKGLPKVCLKCTTDLDLALARLITVDSRKEDETDGQVTSRYLDEICEELAKPENEEVVKHINACIAAFKEKVSAATSALGDIKTAANELAGYMETYKNDALARDPFVSTHANLTKLSVDYPTWDWSGPAIVGTGTYIKERVGGMLVAKDATVPTEYDYRLFILGVSTISRKVNFESVELSEEHRSTLIDSAIDIVVDNTKEEVTDVIDVLTGMKSINGVVLDLQRLQNMDPADLFDRIKEYDGFIHKYYQIATAIIDEKIPLPDIDGKDTIKTNAESVKLLCEFMAYFELMERESVFNKVVLLQGGLINSDEKTAFEDAGGTTLMIAHYIRYMYKDDVKKIPARGISSKVIIESAAHNEKVVKADISNVANRIAIATTSARVEAFNTVAHRYIVNKVNHDNPDMPDSTKTTEVENFMRGLVKKIATRILHHDIAFVDAALMLIVESDYHGTFVESMYNELGAAYLARIQTAEDGKVTDFDLQVAEMSVVARMVSNFVVEHLITCCSDCKDNTVKSPIVPEKE